MSHMRFRVNPHSIVAWMSSNTMFKNTRYLKIKWLYQDSKGVRDMIKTYSQMHRTDKDSKHRSIIWPVWLVWLNGWTFVFELIGRGFESLCSHLIFLHRTCFEQGVPWHSGNYRMWIPSETRTWHDNNIQSNPPYR